MMEGIMESMMGTGHGHGAGRSTRGAHVIEVGCIIDGAERVPFGLL